MVLVYADEKSPRLDYTARLIFQEILGSEVEITTDIHHFRMALLPKINYSRNRTGDELFLLPASLLFSTGTAMPAVIPVSCGEETGFFATPAGSFLPFDPFASAFLMVSRMEEYASVKRDAHDRYPASESILHKHNLLGKAVVNRWALMIAEKLEEKEGRPIFPARKFSFLSTIDVDNAWAYRNKGFLRSAASLTGKILRRNLPGIKEQINVWTGKRTDPYDTYPFLTDIFQGHEEQVRFFFLLGDFGRYDRQVFWKNSEFQGLIREITRKYRTGLHPSYSASSGTSAHLIRKEKERLKKITGEEVTLSRYHFLRLRFPESYRMLTEAGLTDDFSMGYPDMPGFRAGIATPFYFYDLLREEATRLLIHPFQVMDVTLQLYLGLTPGEALEKIRTLMEEVKHCGGTFCSIWHNESLSDQGTWKGYHQVFESMNETGFRYGNE